jgi:hypothetical protein
MLRAYIVHSRDYRAGVRIDSSLRPSSRLTASRHGRVDQEPQKALR